MGVVYHANYLVWCEMGRTELIRDRLGISYAEIEASGVLLAVTDASLRYRAAARYDEEIRVDTWLSEVRSRGVEFDYEIVRADGDERLVSARTRLTSLGGEMRPTRLPEPVLRRFQALLGDEG